MNLVFLTPGLSAREIQELRSNCDCLFIDHKKLNGSKDSFQVDDESFDIRKQPLRLVVISLHHLKRDWEVLNDRFRRNTMIIAADEEVRGSPEIVRFLEERGVALLMCGRNKKGLLDGEGLFKSLTSLKLSTILIEDHIDLLPDLTPLV